MVQKSATDEPAGYAPSKFNIFELVLLWAVSFYALVKLIGVSQGVNLDLIVENQTIKFCLEEDKCGIFGGFLSFDPFVNGPSWIVLKAFFMQIGMTLDRLHMLIIGMDALGLVIVAVCGAMVGGRVFGLLAMMAAFSLIQPLTDINVNLRSTFFPHCALMLFFVAAAVYDSLFFLVCASIGTAITINIYLPNLPIALAPPICALFIRKEKRARTFLTATAAMILAIFALAPGLWFSYAKLGLTGELFHQQGVFVEKNPDFRVSNYTIFCITAAAASIVAAIFHFKNDVFKRTSLTLMWILMPGTVIYLAVSFKANHIMGDNYIRHLIPTSVVSFAALGGVLCHFLKSKLSWLKAARDKLKGRYATIGSAAFRTSAIAVTALAMSGFLQTWGRDPMAPMAFSNSDLEKVRGLLQDRYSWTLPMMYRHIRGSEAEDLRFHMLVSLPRPESVEPQDKNAGVDVLVFKTEYERIPDPPPPNWHVYKPGGWGQSSLNRKAVVVAAYKSRVDWNKFKVCKVSTTGEESCMETGLRYGPMSPGMGAVNQINMELISSSSGNETIRLKYPLKPLPNNKEYVFSLLREEKNTPDRISLLRVEGEGDNQELIHECRNCTVKPILYPPFFLEGSPDAVRALKVLILNNDFSDEDTELVNRVFSRESNNNLGIVSNDKEDLLQLAASVEKSPIREKKTVKSPGKRTPGFPLMSRLGLPQFLFFFPNKWFAVAQGAAEAIFLFGGVFAGLAVYLFGRPRKGLLAL